MLGVLKHFAKHGAHSWILLALGCIVPEIRVLE
jgi:hypothetical protein